MTESASADLARVQRWLDAGATVRQLQRTAGRVTVALCSCDGGEELERFSSAEPALLEYLDRLDQRRPGHLRTGR